MGYRRTLQSNNLQERLVRLNRAGVRDYECARRHWCSATGKTRGYGSAADGFVSTSESHYYRSIRPVSLRLRFSTAAFRPTRGLNGNYSPSRKLPAALDHGTDSSIFNESTKTYDDIKYMQGNFIGSAEVSARLST